MCYVWAVVTPSGVPVAETIAEYAEHAIARFLLTSPAENRNATGWQEWQAKGYACERFALVHESGRAR